MLIQRLSGWAGSLNGHAWIAVHVHPHLPTCNHAIHAGTGWVGSITAGWATKLEAHENTTEASEVITALSFSCYELADSESSQSETSDLTETATFEIDLPSDAHWPAYILENINTSSSPLGGFNAFFITCVLLCFVTFSFIASICLIESGSCCHQILRTQQ